MAAGTIRVGSGVLRGSFVALFVLLWGPLPRSIAEPAAAFMLGWLPVLVGSFVAPHQRILVGAVICPFVAMRTVSGEGFRPLVTLIGGLAAVVFAAWWFNPRRTAQQTKLVAIGAGVTLTGLVVLWCVRYLDWPARPDPLSSDLKMLLGARSSDVAAFYLCDRGGFIDREWLWCIKAKPEVIALVVNGLDLRGANSVPRQFWHMPPHYWPRSATREVEAFASQRFVAGRRGPDGLHYFLVHDKARQIAFVWVKSNV